MSSVGIQLPCVGIHDKVNKVPGCSAKWSTTGTRQAVRCDVSSTVASDPRAGEGTKFRFQLLSERAEARGNLRCQKQEFTRSMTRSLCAAPVGRALTRSLRIRAISIWRSVLPATRSLRVNRSWSTRLAGWSASAVSSLTRTQARPRRRRRSKQSR